MRFDLVDLRLFLRVAEAQSITRGAERSNLALASASGRIRGMEIALGTPLLARGRRGVKLTAAGQCLIEHARLVVQQVERMRSDLGSFARGLSGSVRLLSNTAALSEHLPRVLAAFLAANPTICLDIEERESADIGSALASGAADVGIASTAALPDSIEQFPFREDVLVLVVSPGRHPNPPATAGLGRRHRPPIHWTAARKRPSAARRRTRGSAGCDLEHPGTRDELRRRVRDGRGRRRSRYRARGYGEALPPQHENRRHAAARPLGVAALGNLRKAAKQSAYRSSASR